MIFYFTGTGNSLSVARQLAAPGEALVNLADVRWEEKAYTLAEDENLGFVFPVCFYGLPDTVRQTVQKLRLEGKPGYTYAVITCGGSIGGTGNLLGKFLKESGISLRAVFSVKMPDNYVLLYDATTMEQEKEVFQKAEPVLENIKAAIACRKFTSFGSFAAKAQTAALYPFYDRTRATGKFYADDSCIGCGACAARCPAKAIEMAEGKPVWVKDHCDHCLSCVRCNSVQFGTRLKDRYRYEHPIFRK